MHLTRERFSSKVLFPGSTCYCQTFLFPTLPPFSPSQPDTQTTACSLLFLPISPPSHLSLTHTFKNKWPCGDHWTPETNITNSVQFSCSVMSDPLWPHELQHARLPCLSLSPGACSNSCPLRQWCHPTISSSVVPFSSHPQLFPASGSFQVSSLHQVAKVLEFQLQHQPFQWIFRTDFL